MTATTTAQALETTTTDSRVRRISRRFGALAATSAIVGAGIVASAAPASCNDQTGCSRGEAADWWLASEC